MGEEKLLFEEGKLVWRLFLEVELLKLEGFGLVKVELVKDLSQEVVCSKRAV